MDWYLQHRATQHFSPPSKTSAPKHGTLFWETSTLREYFPSRHNFVRSICREQADVVYLGKDPKTLIRDAMRQMIEEDSIPDLILDGSPPTQQTHIPGFVGVLHRIKVDKNPETLIWKLPAHLEENGLSEYASIDKGFEPALNPDGSNGVQYTLDLQYYFPQDVWDSRKSGWLQGLVQRDVEWLKAVIQDLHEAFEENARELTTLIHTEILDKWQSAMDVAAEIGTAPLPVEETDEDGSVPKTAPYSVHKNYLFGRQEGVCNGCGRRFCFEQMTVDHIVPRSKDGGNELANLQLLCQPCNNLKNDDSHGDLMSRLAAQGPTNPPCCGC